MCMEGGDANEWLAIYFLASWAIANGDRFDRRPTALPLKRILHGRSQPPPHGDGIRKRVRLNSAVHQILRTSMGSRPGEIARER